MPVNLTLSLPLTRYFQSSDARFVKIEFLAALEIFGLGHALCVNELCALHMVRNERVGVLTP